MNDADAQNGEWRDLLEVWSPRLLLFARQQAPEPAEAEDLVQEAFVRFWKARRGQPALEPSLLFTLIRRLAVDRARQLRRQRAGRSRLEAEAASGSSWFEPVLDGRERSELLEVQLRQLPPEQREVLVLKIWGGLTFEQIGATLDIPPETAASRYRYGLHQMRRRLTPVFS